VLQDYGVVALEFVIVALAIITNEIGEKSLL
jgi:hypothetical protein